MAQISAADVSKLRQMTSAGMMDCKKALEEADGNFEKAIEIIRKKGQMVASKRADRDATEGVVIAKTTDDGKFGAIVTLNCETDFVAKNQNFITLTGKILDLVVSEKPANLEALKQLKFEGKTVGEKVIEQVGIIGEKIDVGYYGKIEAEMVISYIHQGNRLSTLVGLNKKVDPQVGKNVAMQIAAMNPVTIDKDDVTPEMIEKEKEIGREQARREGKPENMLDKIAEGKLQKFFKESTLLNQEYTKDSKMTVRQYLQSIDKDLSVTGFLRYTLNQ
jgi:elongation factor Ts